MSKEKDNTFQQMMKDVRRLKPDNKVLHRPRQSNKPIQQSNDPEAELFDYDLTAINITAEQTLFFARTGVQHRTLQKLKRGTMAIEMQLDLHGLTVKEANQAVSDFLQAAIEQGCRHVRIIHGKGNLSMKGAVLKSYVNYWLQQHDDILAFSSAPRHQGGSGAVNVLLRKR